MMLGFVFLMVVVAKHVPMPDTWLGNVALLMMALWVLAMWALYDYKHFLFAVGVLILGCLIVASVRVPSEEWEQYRLQQQSLLDQQWKRKRKRKRKGRKREGRRRAVWIEKWARIHSAALKTTRWRLRRLRRGRFALRPNRAPRGGRSGICCAVCVRRPCVCKVAELERRGAATSIVGVQGAVEQSASEGLGGEPGFRRTFRGGAGSGRRPAGF